MYISIMFWKTKPLYTVSIPQPCHENWQEMSPVERGRFCQACQTVVTDFSSLSDDEIIQHIERSAGAKMCGRFSNEQINRPLLPEIKVHRISHFRKMAASVFLFYASISEALAQVPASQHHTYTAADTKRPVPKFNGITISGRVTDFTGQGFPHLELQIAGTDTIKTTDAYGRFKFRLPESFADKEIVITPTKNGNALLDSTGSFIHDTKLCVDSAPGKKELTIYRYPLEVLKEVSIQQPYIKYSQVSVTSGVVVCTPTIGIMALPDDTKPSKLPVWQKVRKFFKRKRNS